MARRPTFNRVYGGLFGLDASGRPVFNLPNGGQLILNVDGSWVPTMQTVDENGTVYVSGLPVLSGGVYQFGGGIHATGDIETDQDVLAVNVDATAVTADTVEGTTVTGTTEVTSPLVTADSLVVNDDAYVFGDTYQNTTVLSAVQGEGIKVNKGSPSYPWRDLEGLVYPDSTAGAVRGQFITNVYQFAYTNGKTVDFSFHIPHDLVIGSAMYIHVHWAHNADTTATGTVTFNFKISHAKGHDRENFSAAISPSISYDMVNIATTPRYRHRIDEVQLTASSPTASQLDADDIDVDGLIIGTMTVDLSSATLTTASPVNSIYIFTIDLHYQSTGIGTVNKEPSFHGDNSNVGTGSMSAGRASITAAGTRVGTRTGTGAVVSGVASMSGVVDVGQRATAALLSGRASVTGAGTRVGTRTGTGNVVAGGSSISGSGTET